MYLQTLNEAEKAENFKIIDNMGKRINFLRNPRFKTNKAPITLDKVNLNWVRFNQITKFKIISKI